MNNRASGIAGKQLQSLTGKVTRAAKPAGPKPGVLTAQFSTERGLAAAAIRWLSAGYYSHVDLVVSQGVAAKYGYPIPGAEALLGARANGGVQLRDWNYAKFTVRVIKNVVVPDIDAAYRFAFAQMHKLYATKRILDFGLHKFGKDTPFQADRKSWFCDELLYEICAAGGRYLLATENPLNLTPYELALSPCWGK